MRKPIRCAVLMICLICPVRATVASEEILVQNEFFFLPNLSPGQPMNTDRLRSRGIGSYSGLNDSFLREYQAAKSADSITVSAIKGASYVLEFAAGELPISSRVLPEFLAGAAGKLLQDGISALGESAVRNLEESAQETLAWGLEEYRKRNSQLSLESLTHQPPEEIFKAVFGDSELFNNPIYAGLSPAEKDVYQVFLSSTLADSVAKNTLLTYDTRNAQREAIDKFGKAFQFTLQVSRNTDAKLGKITAMMSDIRDDIEALQRSHDPQTMRFLQEYLYGQMDPGQRIAALKSGFNAGLQGAARETELAKLQLLQKRQQVDALIAGVGEFLGKAGVIANGLGLSADFTRGIQQAAKITTGARTVMDNLLPPKTNLLNAAAAIFGMFGPSAEEVAEQRHAQIMKGIGDLLEGQREIKEGIRYLAQGQAQILSNQRALMELQLETLEALFKVHHHIQKRLDAIDKDLGRIRAKLDDSLALGIANLEKDLDLCYVFLRRRSSDLAKPTLLATFSSYDDVKEHFGSLGQYFDDCVRGLDLLLGYQRSRGRPSPVLLSRFYEHAEKNQLEQFREAVFTPAYQYYASKAGGGDTFLEDQFHAPRLAEVARLIVELHPFFQLTDARSSGVRLRTKEEVLRTPSAGTRHGQELLEFALEMVDAAITQELMLIGGGLQLQRVDEELKKPINAEAKDRTLDMLRKNPWMAQNFAAYSLAHTAMEGGWRPWIYGKMLETAASPYYLDKLGGGKWRFTRSESGWQCTLAGSDITIPAPAAAALHATTYYRRPELSVLTAVRAQLLDELMAYGFWKTRTPEERSLYVEARQWRTIN